MKMYKFEIKFKVFPQKAQSLPYIQHPKSWAIFLGSAVRCQRDDYCGSTIF